MSITSKDIVPLKDMRERLTELAEEVCQVQENIHLTLLEEAARGWDAVEAGKLLPVAELKSRYGREE